jgi:integrase
MWVEKHGKSWRIRDRVGEQKVTIADGYPTKTAARDGMTELRADQLRGESLVVRGGRVVMADWLDMWWPPYAAGLKPSSRISAEVILRRHVRPALGAIPLEDLDPLAVRRWVADLSAGRTASRRPLAPKTVRNAHGLLHRVLADAVQQRLIRSNPCIGAGLPEVVHTEMRFLTEPEAERLLAALPARWRPLVLLLLFTGLRWGEAVGLRIGRVDVLARKLTVLETMQELPNTAELVFVTPKTKGSRRTVTFPVRVAAELAGLVGRERGELLFTAAMGGPVRYRHFRAKVWVPARQAAGLDGLRLHDLRHTHASWLISAGVPLTAISRRLGHASISVTSDRYGHLMPEVDAGIMATLDGALDKIDGGGTVGATVPESHGGTRSTTDEYAGQGMREGL